MSIPTPGDAIPQSGSKMRVVKRSGAFEEVNFEKITERIKKLCWNLTAVDPSLIVRHVASSIVDGISTEAIDHLTAEIAISMDSEHPDYGKLAARIAMSNIHKKTSESILETFEKMESVVSSTFLATVRAHADDLQDMVQYNRDYEFDYFGIKTLERMYCTKIDNELIERPQHMYLRVAVALCGQEGVDRIRETYELLSRKFFTHASPTLFNAGMKVQQLASCYLDSSDDSLDGIFACFHRCARISKYGGGLGVNVSSVRSKGAPIASTNGHSDGIIPMLKVANSVASYVNQGGKRKGSMAVYVEPHHPDIFDFLNLRRPGGDEDLRCRDLFLAVWVSDLFMKRVEAGAQWSLMDPSKCPGLDEVYGEEFERLYERYESEGKAEKVIDAREVWNAILRAQIESGVPYILSKDACNTKSNQKNVGTIKNSNLCAEIVEYSSPGKEVAVCTLASIGLPAFVKHGAFDFKELHRVVKVVAKNLDRVIDLNHYPIDEAKTSNFRHRPIGIGIQGLADTFIKLRMPFDSKAALELNEQILATMYHAAIEASTELASVYGPYASYDGSPASQGLLQYDLWGVAPCPVNGLLDWDALKRRVHRYGLRNSLSIALMPTASTAQLLGNSEAAEPVTSFFYVRRTLAGEYACIHRYLLRDLVQRGLWNKAIKDALIRDGGSVQNIPDIPDDLKAIYKTSWDLKQRVIIDQAAARGPYVCQSQSMNLFIAAPTFAKLTAMHLYSWKKGLKTINYYLRSKPASRAAQVTVESYTPSVSSPSASSLPSLVSSSDDDEEACIHCSG